MDLEQRIAQVIRIHEALSKGVAKIAIELRSTNVNLLHHDIHKISIIYMDFIDESRITGNASSVSNQIQRIVDSSTALIEALNALGPGANKLMGIGLNNWTRDRGLDAFELPGIEAQVVPPHTPFPLDEWISRLCELKTTAVSRKEVVKELTKRGGRIPFSARVHGDHEEWLAHACQELAVEHGCGSQATVLRIVQTVQHAVNGKKGSKYIGRKAVRKLA